MKNVLLNTAAALAIVLALPTPASAQDWTGFYVGAQGGYGEGNGDHTITEDGFGFLGAPFGPDTIKGGFMGGQLGCDHQINMLVFGLNGEMNYSSISGFFDNLPPGVDDGYETEIKWFGSVRGRLGVVLPNMPDLMVYATGGVAFARIRGQNGDLEPGIGFNCAGTGCATGSKTATGYTVGGGLAFQVPIPGSTNLLVINAEYAYYDFGNVGISTTTQPNGDPHSFDVNTDIHTARIGASIKF